MTAYLPDASETPLSPLAKLVLGLHLQGFGSVRVALVRGDIVIEGSVPTYAAKCRIELAARESGFSVRNCLRVVPGRPPMTALSPQEGAPSFPAFT